MPNHWSHMIHCFLNFLEQLSRILEDGIHTKCIFFFYNADVIFNREDDVISPADDATDGPLCFYDVLADYFVRVPESGKPVLDLIVQLWSQSFASHIFTLLFHKWVCELESAILSCCFLEDMFT